MRKIDLRDYSVGDGQGTFSVRTSLVAVLFNERGLDGREIIRRDELATRIEQVTGDSLLLEEDDYRKILGGIAGTDLLPYGRSAAEFLRRVYDAPTVSVQEKPETT